MTDHLNPEPPGDDEPFDLFAVGADDRLLDDLGQDLPAEDGVDDPAERVLTAWRASLLPHQLPEPPVVTPVAPVRRRAMPMIAAATAIVALLLGTAAIGSRAAGPDDMLWPLTKLLWPDRIASVDAAEHAEIALDLARTALDDGEPPQASIVLTAAAQEISRVQPRDGRAELDADYDQLWTELEEVMAIATFPSGSTLTTPPTRPTDSRTSTSSPATSGSTPAPSTPTGATGSSTRSPATTGSQEPVPPPTTTTTPPPSTTTTTDTPPPTATDDPSTTEATTTNTPPTTVVTPEPVSPSESSSSPSSVPEPPLPDSPAAESPEDLQQLRLPDAQADAGTPTELTADTGAN